jgi:hypothetical protein
VEVKKPSDPARTSPTTLLERVRNLFSSEEYATARDLIALGQTDAASQYVSEVLEDNDLCVPDIAFLRPTRASDGVATR